MKRYIFVTGGVLSSLGKGIAAASLGVLLQARGYKVRIRKLDPYLNCDPGTMSPYQHGEVFVTEDGAETDLDLGHYERFLHQNCSSFDTTTAGKIYSNVIDKERKGDYLGATVQVIPHITDEIKEYIANDDFDADFMICEIGGTIGDIESLPFIEAIRQFAYAVGRENTLFMHLTLLPYLTTSGEIKTKPTQHSVKELLSHGIQPDILLCRASKLITEDERKKISLFCNLPQKNVISAIDVSSIYKVPSNLHEQGLDTVVCNHFNLKSKKNPDLTLWASFTKKLTSPEGEVNIAIIGKYTSLQDAYKSLNEALIHASVTNNVRVNSRWINSEEITAAKAESIFSNIDAILVPGGFGSRGIDGKIEAVRYARERKIPYFGICLGMQIGVIEYARNKCGISDATSSEFNSNGIPVVGLMTEWHHADGVETRDTHSDLGGSMRLGSHESVLKKDSKIHNIYKTITIEERHRHRYEVNLNYVKILEDKGLMFSGFSPDGNLPETVEIADHPWFVGVQFHPEFKSRPFAPHPLFVSFIEAAMKQSRLV